MAKSKSGLKFIILLMAFGIFCWFEYGIYKEYRSVRALGEYKIKEKTQELEDAFLLREKGFYSDTLYKREFLKLKEEEKDKEKSLIEGEDNSGKTGTIN